MVTDTSLQAFEDLQPVIGVRQSQVFAILKSLGPSSNMELARALGWSVSCVTPRIVELRKLGLVRDAGVRACKVTTRLVHTWGVAW